MILIDHPVFNEPGYEKQIGSTSGDNMSKSYNQNIRYYTMCHNVYDMLNKPDAYPEFKEAILKHFRLKKNYILETYKKWVDSVLPQSNNITSSISKSMLETKYGEIKALLQKL